MDCLDERVDRRMVALSRILFVSEDIKSLNCMCSIVCIKYVVIFPVYF